MVFVTSVMLVLVASVASLTSVMLVTSAMLVSVASVASLLVVVVSCLAGVR